MPETIQIGPLFIQMDWLYALITIGMALFYIKKQVSAKEIIMNTLENGLFIVFLFWKFSIYLFQPSLIKQPLGLLYFNGGSKGLTLGLIAAILYVGYKCRKSNWIIRDVQIVIESVFLGFFIFSICNVLQQNSSIVYWGLIMTIAVLMWGLLKFKKQHIYQAYLWFTVMIFAVELFLNNGPASFFGFTTIQVSLIVGMLSLAIHQVGKKEKQEQDLSIPANKNSRLERRRSK